MDLSSFFRMYPRVALAFSGGVDSAYLLYAAKEAGAEVTAYYVKSQFQPRFELDDAIRLTKELSVPMRVLSLNVLAKEEIVLNPENRCYHCKKMIFEAIRENALQDGFSVLLDGTNASDDEGDRPGMKALRELSVISPLKQCGLSKSDIRSLSREANLFTWDKPAYACLATRVKCGERITADILEKIEKAENFLMNLGFSNLRVRVSREEAKLQLPVSQFDMFYANRKEIETELKKYFKSFVFDTNGRP